MVSVGEVDHYPRQSFHCAANSAEPALVIDKTRPKNVITCSDTFSQMIIKCLTLWRPLLPYERRVSECPDVKSYKWRLNPVWHRKHYSCTQYGNSERQMVKDRLSARKLVGLQLVDEDCHQVTHDSCLWSGR